MNIEELRDYCLEKKAVVEETPFGPDTLVFKVGAKIFLLVGLDQVNELRFNVKCDPAYAIDLRQKYESSVIPGYHMNKKHWNTVYCNRELNDVFVRELIDDSYELVFSSLTKRQQEDINNKG